MWKLTLLGYEKEGKMDEIIRVNGEYRIKHYVEEDKQEVLFTEAEMRKHIHGNGHMHEYIRFSFVAEDIEDYRMRNTLVERLEKEQWTRVNMRRSRNGKSAGGEGAG